MGDPVASRGLADAFVPILWVFHPHLHAPILLFLHPYMHAHLIRCMQAHCFRQEPRLLGA